MTSQDADTILYYAKNPTHHGEIQDATIVHTESNRVCGDDITIYLLIQGNTIQDWSFTGNSSMITTACSSLFGEIVIGQKIEDIFSWDQKYLEKETEIHVTPRRRRAQVLALLATRNAIHIWKEDGIRDDFSEVVDI